MIVDFLLRLMILQIIQPHTPGTHGLKWVQIPVHVHAASKEGPTLMTEVAIRSMTWPILRPSRMNSLEHARIFIMHTVQLLDEGGLCFVLCFCSQGVPSPADDEVDLKVEHPREELCFEKIPARYGHMNALAPEHSDTELRIATLIEGFQCVCGYRLNSVHPLVLWR